MFVFIFLISCGDSSEKVIPGNIAPPDPTVSTVTKENYINRTYISLLGRKASDVEFQNAITLLNRNNASISDRNDLLDNIIDQDEYVDRLYELARADLLNNVDTVTISDFIYLLEDQLERETDPFVIDLINIEIGNFMNLRAIPEGLKNGGIDVAEMHKRCLDNLIYDEINMGTENYVLSAFQNLLGRSPTSAVGVETSELESSKTMVDGFQAVLFLKAGDSQQDFLDIMVEANDYFEAQVIQQYNRFLFRDPTSEEMRDLAIKYKSSASYAQMQKEILSLDEYLGI